MIFETHAHYDDDAFDNDRETLIAELPRQGISPVVNVGASLDSCRRTLKLVERYPFFYGAIGVHPSETRELNEENFPLLKEWCSRERILAVGEIGLDYHYEDTDRTTQQFWFGRQLDLAKELGLPVIIHSREAAQDTITCMQEHDAEHIGGVVHCYSYSAELAKTFLKMGFYFGIGGVITFQNGKKLRETVEMLPMERIVLETDCPYLAPVPHRGERNSSLNLPLVVEQIAQIKNRTAEEVIRITEENARQLFRLDSAQ